MIIKGNQRGGGRALAAHLTNTRANDHVELHELRGFLSHDLAGAFLEIEAAASGTKCQQPFFSVSLNPPKGCNAAVEDFEQAAELIEAKFPGLKDQPRALIFHEKEGRRHCHAVWSRIHERGPAAQLSHSREKLRDISRAMFEALAIEAPAGIRDRTKADPLNYDRPAWQQAKRMGEDPRDLKAIIQNAWAASDDRASFERALERNALFLARGDKRGFVVVDPGGEALSLTRYSGVKAKDLKARLGPPEQLPTVDQARSMLHDKMMTAVPPGPGNAMRDRHRQELRPLVLEHQAMKKAHREQRQALDRKHGGRARQEEQARARRLRSGIMGLWDRLSGRRGKVSERNVREAAAGKMRDRAERHALIEAQMQERGELQGRVMQLRDRHRRDRQDDRARTAFALSLFRDDVRADFRDAMQRIEDRKNTPPTAARMRRERAEKLGIMPVIVDSDRVRSRGGKRGRGSGAENSPPGLAPGQAVEGVEAGTGETAPDHGQPTPAPPEATQQHDSGQAAGPALKTGWTNDAEREAAIKAEREAREARDAQERDATNDNDPGRQFEP